MVTITEAVRELAEAIKSCWRVYLRSIGLVTLREHRALQFDLFIAERERDYYRSIKQPRDVKGRFTKRRMNNAPKH